MTFLVLSPGSLSLDWFLSVPLTVCEGVVGAVSFIVFCL